MVSSKLEVFGLNSGSFGKIRTDSRKFGQFLSDSEIFKEELEIKSFEFIRIYCNLSGFIVIFPNLFQFVRICSNLSKFVSIHPNFPKSLQIRSNKFLQIGLSVQSLLHPSCKSESPKFTIYFRPVKFIDVFSMRGRCLIACKSFLRIHSRIP